MTTIETSRERGRRMQLEQIAEALDKSTDDTLATVAEILADAQATAEGQHNLVQLLRCLGNLATNEATARRNAARAARPQAELLAEAAEHLRTVDPDKALQALEEVQGLRPTPPSPYLRHRQNRHPNAIDADVVDPTPDAQPPPA